LEEVDSPNFSSLIATFLEKRLNPVRVGNSREDRKRFISPYVQDPVVWRKEEK
jgi:hypothetical protein